MPFVKNKSGNLNGRPKKGETHKDIIEKIGSEKIGTSKGKIKTKELMWRSIYKSAISGDVQAAKLLVERTEGKVPENFNLQHNGVIENKISFVIQNDTQKQLIENLTQKIITDGI